MQESRTIVCGWLTLKQKMLSSWLCPLTASTGSSKITFPLTFFGTSWLYSAGLPTSIHHASRLSLLLIKPLFFSGTILVSEIANIFNSVFTTLII